MILTKSSTAKPSGVQTPLFHVAPASNDDQSLSRVALPSIIVGSVLLVFAMIAALLVFKLQDNNAGILARDVASVQAAYQLELGVRELRAKFTRFMMSNDRTYLSDYPAVRQQTDAALAKVKLLASSKDEISLLNTIESGYKSLLAMFDESTSLHDPDPTWSIEQQVEIDELFRRELVVPAGAYRAINETSINAGTIANVEMSKKLMWSFIVIGICGAFGGAFMGISAARKVRNRIIELSIPIHAAAGRLEQIVGNITVSSKGDLSNINELTQRISSHIEQIVERLRTKELEVLRNEQLASVGQLAAGIAHEIRNPLTALKILVQSAVASSETVLTMEDLIVMEQEINRMETSIQALLNFARPAPLRRDSFTLQDVVHDAIHLTSGQTSLLNINFTVVVPEDPITLHADRTQIHQLLVNLLLNGAEAAGPYGRLRLLINQEKLNTLTSGMETDVSNSFALNDGWISIVVSDSGPGIPNEFREKIFEPFFSTKATGTGLGLSTCKRIATQHGGTISVQDGELGGASFVISLPAKPSSTKAALDHSLQAMLAKQSPYQGEMVHA